MISRFPQKPHPTPSQPPTACVPVQAIAGVKYDEMCGYDDYTFILVVKLFPVL